MKKLTLGLISAAIAAVIPAASMAAHVDVNIALPLPPAPVVTVEAAAPEMVPPAPLQFQTAPEMVVVPSGNAYVYMVPNVYGVYFYEGAWFRYHNGFWFRSAAWNGYWAPVQVGIVPGVIIGLSPEYAMYLPVGYYRIPFAHFHMHWRTWGHSHHWHGHHWFKHQVKHHHGFNKGLHKGVHGGIHKVGPHGGKKVMPGSLHKNSHSIKKIAPSGLHKAQSKGIHKKV